MPLAQTILTVKNYDLALTLSSGQTFRWRRSGNAWEGVIGSRWVRLQQEADGLRAFSLSRDEGVGEGRAEGRPISEIPRGRAQEDPPLPGPLLHCMEEREAHRGEVVASSGTGLPHSDFPWLRHYLQTEVDLEPILAAFPDDPPMREAVAACRGLRLLRQDPWECLASFICSSSKQIVQIEQIVELLCRRFGEPLPVPPGVQETWTFPTVQRLASVSEADLRACKMGFRAPYVLGAARKLAEGALDLSRLGDRPLEEARAALLELPGVGVKIADCVLLFAYGFQEAFPVDVWIAKALQQLYFPKRRAKLPRLRRFSQSHFGPYGGYAQQYLFHYMRKGKRAPNPNHK